MNTHHMTGFGFDDQFGGEWVRAAIAVAGDRYREAAHEVIANGYSPVPTLFMFTDHADDPLTGIITARRSFPGGDAAAAIADLGWLPAVLRPDRLLICWEHRTLAAQLGAGHQPATGIVSLEADKKATSVVWHPFTVTIGAATNHGLTELEPSWQRQQPFTETPPIPVTEAVGQWREGRGDHIAEVITALENDGYVIEIPDQALPHRDGQN